jgi:hypothetical protein
VDASIPRLVGKVYDLAPARERSRLLEHLLRPLGALSLRTVASGIFASIHVRSDWHDSHVRPEDIQNVRASDVIALVDHVQMVSVAAVDGLGQVVATSPVPASSAAVGLLLTALMWRAHARRQVARAAAAANSATD